MTPLELYSILKTNYSIHEVESVCCVEKTCKRNGFCVDYQHEKVLDFDNIKKDYYKGSSIPMPASVDAVCVGGKYEHFCFVEMKGWDNYINYLEKQKKSIEQTVEGYNLEGKLMDSQELCINITKDKDLFAHMPVIFLLVTDIDVKANGIVSFADMINKLGGNSTDIYSKCLSEAQKTLDSEIHIEHQYIYCKEFDKNILVL